MRSLPTLVNRLITNGNWRDEGLGVRVARYNLYGYETHLFPLQVACWVSFQTGWLVRSHRTHELPGASGSSIGT